MHVGIPCHFKGICYLKLTDLMSGALAVSKIFSFSAGGRLLRQDEAVGTRQLSALLVLKNLPVFRLADFPVSLCHSYHGGQRFGSCAFGALAAACA